MTPGQKQALDELTADSQQLGLGYRMTSHSPTPWKAHEELDGTWSIDHAANGSVVTEGLSELDAKHIVHCVNRCHEWDERMNGAWTEYVDGITKHMPADVAEETRRLVTKNSTLTSEELSSN